MLEAVEVEEQQRPRALLARLAARRAGRSTCIRPRLASPVNGSVRTCSSSALFSRSLIARRRITAVIVAAQRIVERPLVALKYCIAKRPIMTPAKTAGTMISRQLSTLRRGR